MATQFHTKFLDLTSSAYSTSTSRIFFRTDPGLTFSTWVSRMAMHSSAALMAIPQRTFRALIRIRQTFNQNERSYEVSEMPETTRVTS